MDNRELIKKMLIEELDSTGGNVDSGEVEQKSDVKNVVKILDRNPALKSRLKLINTPEEFGQFLGEILSYLNPKLQRSSILKTISYKVISDYLGQKY